MGPINYSTDVQTPFQAALQGYAGGSAIRDDQFKQQQQQQALELQKQQQADLTGLFNNPNASARDYAALTLKYPSLREQLKQGWDMESGERQKANLEFSTRTYAALSSGRPDVAEKLFRDRAAAMRSSGAPEQDIKANETWAELIKTSPEQARHIGGLMLSSVMGDKFGETFGKLGQEGRANAEAPADLAKKTADAAKAGSEATKSAVDAKYAEQQAVTDLQKKGWDIRAIQEDIGFKKEANRISLMNAQTSRESNSLKREELQLKVQEARQKLDDSIRSKTAEVESARSATDNFLNTADRLLGLAADKNGKPTSTLRAAAGPVDSRFPTTQQDVADLEALAETLGSQAFLSQLPAMKGLGALSEKEGDKLQSSLTNLSLRQSPEQLVANIKEAQRLILKARKNISTKYGVPDSVPDTPAVQSSGTEIEDLVRKYVRR